LKVVKTHLDLGPMNTSRQPIATSDQHVVLGTSMRAFPAGSEVAIFGMGCFWGVERKFWVQPGVVSTQVGYAAGTLEHPTYKEVCTGQTGHNEVVRVVFGMRQGNDVGTQYRSGIYVTSDAQKLAAEASREAFQGKLAAAGYGKITTEIIAAPTFYYAEDYHQQYLEKNPDGYCGLAGTGVSCPVSLGV
jgi:peptide-methionine (S)-S-oxide reductase